jgi:hypothetical protein
VAKKSTPKKSKIDEWGLPEPSDALEFGLAESVDRFRGSLQPWMACSGFESQEVATYFCRFLTEYEAADLSFALRKAADTADRLLPI